jgi:hypothetical protein
MSRPHRRLPTVGVGFPLTFAWDWSSLSDKAFRLIVAMWGVSAAELKDGVLAETDVARVKMCVPRVKAAHFDELVIAGLLERVDEGYALVGWGACNATRAQVEGWRKKWREEKRRARAAAQTPH